MKVIDENDLIKKYDFSSIISKSDDHEACKIVTKIIESGNYFTNSPKFQTKENVFARPEEVWLKYRMSFLMSVFLYLGKEVRVANMMAWSFMTSLKTAENRESLWHHHWHPTSPDAKMLSGVYYLHIPDNVKDRDYCGTEIAEKGPEKEEKYFIRPQNHSWIVYPSDIWHRPGIVQSQDYRFVLAVDVEYFS